MIDKINKFKTSDDFKIKTSCYKTLIDDTIKTYLKANDKLYASVIDAMSYSCEQAGKRIRPILLLEFNRMFGGNIPDALPFAIAVELIHTYSLIHDDLPCMDNDDLRRGKPSCHRAYGESTALLAGDGLLTLAFEIMSKSSFALNNSPSLAIRAISKIAYYAGVDGMIGGQVLDLEYENKPANDFILNTVNKLKTCALIKTSCINGVILANGTNDSVLKAKQYATYLGLAFQLVDDILDVIGDESKLGKPIGSDSKNKKSTYISLHGLDEATAYANELTENAVQILQTLPNNDYIIYLTRTLLNREN